MTRLLREARGWTQEHLADVSGVSVRTIQRIEAGEPPAHETLLALASAFDLSVADLRDGPHVVIDHETDPWPGLQIKVFKGGRQIGGVIELDSRTRTFKRIGLLLLDIPEDEFFDRVQIGSGAFKMVPGTDGEWVGTMGDVRYDLSDSEPLAEGEEDPADALVAHINANRTPTLVDGKPWDPWEHLVVDTYDTVVAIGHWKVVDHYRAELPKHWAVLDHHHEPRPMPEGVVWRNPDLDWQGEPPAP